MTELLWVGPCDMSGYGVACKNYAVGLTRAGIRVKLVDQAQSIGLAGKGLDASTNLLVARLSKTEVSKGAVRVHQQVPEKLLPSQLAKKNVGYTIFEMTSIPKSWLGYCQAMDEIWTGSEYSRQSFINGGFDQKRIFVVPHIVDTERFIPSATPIVLPNRAQWNFVSVFDFQSRKAWKELITAYAHAFKKNEDVCLWLKCFRHGFRREDQVALLTQLYKFIEEMKFPAMPRIEVCPFDLPNTMMPNFYTAFDCYVSISREGFGLPYAEAAACGLTVISGSENGTREFLNEDNSYLVDFIGNVDLDQAMLSINANFLGLKWSSHSVDHLSQQMRYVFEHQSEARAKGLKARETVQAKLHYSTVAEQVKTLLER